MTPMTERRRRRSPSQRQPPLMNRSPSARIAAASCAASGASQLRQSTPFAATRHDDKPQLARSHSSSDAAEPLRYRRRGAALHRVRLGSLRPRSLHRRCCSMRSSACARTREPLNYRPLPPSRRGTARPSRNRRRAFPIAANRPAASFNPAYVRSPSAMLQPARRRPHITL